jgi:hypothetical protein
MKKINVAGVTGRILVKRSSPGNITFAVALRGRRRRTSVWTLESGTGGTLDLFGKSSCCAAAFDSQSPGHYQRILWGGFREHALVPKGSRSVLREGAAIQAGKIFRCDPLWLAHDVIISVRRKEAQILRARSRQQEHLRPALPLF